jgi:hypothetical protein
MIWLGRPPRFNLRTRPCGTCCAICRQILAFAAKEIC